MAVLAAATLELNADSGKLEAELGRAVQSASLFGTALGTVVGQAITRVSGYLKEQVSSAIESADAWDKLAQKIGTTVERVSEYRVAAALAGTSESALRSAMRALAEHASEAEKATTKAAAAFRAMGIDPKQFATTADLFDAVLGKLNQYEDGIKRDALANATLGRSFQELQPLAEALEKNKGLARELGLELDKNTSQAASRFRDNLKIAELGSQAMATRIAVVLLPTLEKLSGFLVDNAKNTERLDTVARSADTGLKLLATGAAVIGAAFQTAGRFIGGVASAVVSIAAGQYREAARIAMESGFDLASNIRAAAKSVTSVWADAGKESEGKAAETGRKLAAPAMAAAENAKRSAADFKEAIMRIHDDALAAAEADELIAKQRIEASERHANVAALVAQAQVKLARGELTEDWHMDDLVDKIDDKVKRLDDTTRQLGLTFSSAFEDAIVNGSRLDTVLKGIEQDIIRILVRKTLTEPAGNALAAAIGGFFKGGSGSAGADDLPNLFGPGRAAGGPVGAGLAYHVGEFGPETFVPDTAGTILPTGAMGNRYYIDARGADEGAVQRIESALIRLAGPGVTERRSLAAHAEMAWR